MCGQGQTAEKRKGKKKEAKKKTSKKQSRRRKSRLVMTVSNRCVAKVRPLSGGVKVKPFLS